MTELWKSIEGFEGRYEVSDHGRVRSLDYYVRCGPGGVGQRLVRGRVLRPGRMSSGHLSVVLGRVEGSRCVHDLVARAFLGPKKRGDDVRHKDGNPAYNHKRNLVYGSRGENNEDVVFHGRRRLSVVQIQECRRLRRAGWRLSDLASRYDYAEASISSICRRHVYRRVPD